MIPAISQRDIGSYLTGTKTANLTIDYSRGAMNTVAASGIHRGNFRHYFS
jgi:hypothetical protein